MFSLLGHFLLTNAYRLTEASVLQPFSYFHLLFASLVGIIFFKDPLTISTVAGGLLIVFGGILISKKS